MSAPTLDERPRLVRGLPMPRPGFDEVRALLAGCTLWAVSPVDQAHVEVRAEEYFAGFAAGTESRNIVDSYLPDARFEACFPVPAFIDEVDLLRGHARSAHYRRSLVMSPRGAYTPCHADAGGLAGWLYLCEGEKEWELAPPHETPAYHDAASNDYHDPVLRPASPARQAALDALRCTRFIQRAGELVLIPPGAIHCVRTTQASRGWGGAFLAPAQLELAVAFHRFERAHWPAGAVDLLPLLDEVCARHAEAPWRPSLQALIAGARA